MSSSSIFFGTPDFAATILRKLLAAGFVPAAVVTNPDKPAGRGQKNIIPSPVKREAEIFNISRYMFHILQPTRVELKSENFEKQIKTLSPDFFIVAAYGNIISKNILQIPPCGAIGVHPSLLPEARGAWPIQYAILKDFKETGTTILMLDEEVDHGPILAQKSGIEVDRKYYQQLHDELANLSAELLIETLPDFIANKIMPKQQDHSRATYCQMEPGRWNIKKEDGLIDWNLSAKEIDRKVRAFHIWPGAYTFCKRKMLKIYRGELYLGLAEKTPPGIIMEKDGRLLVGCGQDFYAIQSLQLAGGKIFEEKDIKAFLNGHRDFMGSILGS